MVLYLLVYLYLSGSSPDLNRLGLLVVKRLELVFYVAASFGPRFVIVLVLIP